MNNHNDAKLKMLTNKAYAAHGWMMIYMKAIMARERCT